MAMAVRGNSTREAFGLSEAEFSELEAVNDAVMLEEIAELLVSFANDGKENAKWLRTKHILLGRSPLVVLRAGQGKVIRNVLRRAQLGEFT